MALTITIDDIVRFPVAGKINDKEGREREFAFEMDMHRMDQDEIDTALGGDARVDVRSLVQANARGWSGVQDAQGAAVPYSPGSLRDVLRIAGMSLLIWRAYCQHAGVQEKNSARSSV